MRLLSGAIGVEDRRPDRVEGRRVGFNSALETEGFEKRVELVPSIGFGSGKETTDVGGHVHLGSASQGLGNVPSFAGKLAHFIGNDLLGGGGRSGNGSPREDARGFSIWGVPRGPRFRHGFGFAMVGYRSLSLAWAD